MRRHLLARFYAALENDLPVPLDLAVDMMSYGYDIDALEDEFANLREETDDVE